MKTVMVRSGLVLCVLLGLVACGQSGTTTSSSSDQARASSQPVEPGTQSTDVATAEPTQPSAAASEPTAAPEGSPNANAVSTPPIAASHGGPIVDHVSFVDHLRDKGLTVEIVDSVEQPFLKARGTRLRISGADLKQPVELQSYNYDDTDLGSNGLSVAEADAQQIGPDGNPKTTQVNWTAAPHWFHKERVIVLYLGDDPTVLALLTDLLGPPFAGK